MFRNSNSERSKIAKNISYVISMGEFQSSLSNSSRQLETWYWYHNVQNPIYTSNNDVIKHISNRCHSEHRDGFPNIILATERTSSKQFELFLPYVKHCTTLDTELYQIILPIIPHHSEHRDVTIYFFQHVPIICHKLINDNDNYIFIINNRQK